MSAIGSIRTNEMDYIPIVKPSDIRLKNTGKLIVLKIGSKEWELKRDTLKQLLEVGEYVLSAKHPTEWISGYEDIQKEETATLWGEDQDSLMGC